MDKRPFKIYSVRRQTQYVHAMYRKLNNAGIDAAKVYLDEGSSFTCGRLGLYCGTGWDRSMLSHELAHIIQPNARDFFRLYIQGEGTVHFHVPQVFLFGRLFTEPNTDQITRRELDTFAVEYLLCQALHLKTGTLDDYLDRQLVLLGYLPDSGFWSTLEKQKEARQILVDRIAFWSRVDIIKRLNFRLKCIAHVAKLEERIAWYFEYNPALDTVIRHEPTLA